MTKQILESHFVDVIRNNDNLLYQKLYHIMGKYTTVPGDYYVFTDNYRYLIECKECRTKSFVFSRFSQRNDLIKFNDKFSHHISYILLCFWLGRRIKSKYYLIPIHDMCFFIDNIGKKSANMKDFDKYLYMYEIPLERLNTRFV